MYVVQCSNYHGNSDENDNSAEDVLKMCMLSKALERLAGSVYRAILAWHCNVVQTELQKQVNKCRDLASTQQEDSAWEPFQ